jgi:hypothetical protein
MALVADGIHWVPSAAAGTAQRFAEPPVFLQDGQHLIEKFQGR